MVSIFKSNRGSLLQALLLLFVTLALAACQKDDTTPQREKDDKQIQQYFKANDIDPATVTKTSSGLYYQLLEEGDGDRVFPGDEVSVHYVGTFLDGTKFDSSRDRNEPFEFTVGLSSVIAGWHEGLPYMRKGEKARFFIPSHLAYERRGSSTGVVPPNTPLMFEIEVLEILP